MISILVVGVDPSETSKHAMRTGLELATALGAHVHLVGAFVDSAGGGHQVTDQRRAAEQMLERLAEQSGFHAVPVETHALPEKPADAIVRVAREKRADLIVIGNRGAQGTRRVLGSVASAVVAHASCDVLVVKTT